MNTCILIIIQIETMGQCQHRFSLKLLQKRPQRYVKRCVSQVIPNAVTLVMKMNYVRVLEATCPRSMFHSPKTSLLSSYVYRSHIFLLCARIPGVSLFIQISFFCLHFYYLFLIFLRQILSHLHIGHEHFIYTKNNSKLLILVYPPPSTTIRYVPPNLVNAMLQITSRTFCMLGNHIAK